MSFLSKILYWWIEGGNYNLKTKHCVCHNNTIIHHQADSYNQTSFTKYVKFYIFWVQLHIQVYDHFDTTIFHCLVEIYLMPYKYCIDNSTLDTRDCIPNLLLRIYGKMSKYIIVDLYF